eukprot:11114106-Alexandrium_andersonii.AAC.1
MGSHARESGRAALRRSAPASGRSRLIGPRASPGRTRRAASWHAGAWRRRPAAQAAPRPRPPRP